MKVLSSYLVPAASRAGRPLIRPRFAGPPSPASGRRGARGKLGPLAAALIVAAAPGLRADPLPTIVTYELSKARRETRAIARDPKTFWVGAIVARIEDKKPVVDLALKQPATVEVGFVVGRDGRLVSRQVARSSGNPDLDARAVAVIEKAAPFPPMPAGLGEDQMAFTLPLRFK